MDKFFKSFGSYYKDAQFDDFSFWAFPVGTILLIWILAILIPKIFSKRQKLKTIFIINRGWIAASLIVTAIIIGLICYWWTQNYFAEHPFQFSLLLSLFISMLIPVFALLRLRNYFTQEGVKEITDQPKTPSQLDATITFLKRAYRRCMFFYLVPLLGFSMLLFVLSKGTNLISIVLDNTPSQNLSFSDGKAALTQTISQLDENNQIIISSFSSNKNTRKTFDEIVKTNQYNPSVDISSSFTSKNDAINYISSLELTSGDGGSPILEVIWQNYLFAKQNSQNSSFKNKVLLIITDGGETAVIPITANRFFCNVEEFSGFYAPENTFIIDYFTEQDQISASQNSLFIQNAGNCGYDVQKGITKEDYSFALAQVLTGFQNNWYLIFWTITIFVIMAIIGILINPKKIA
jgi:hypothetical protein